MQLPTRGHKPISCPGAHCQPNRNGTTIVLSIVVEGPDDTNHESTRSFGPMQAAISLQKPLPTRGRKRISCPDAHCQQNSIGTILVLSADDFPTPVSTVPFSLWCPLSTCRRRLGALLSAVHLGALSAVRLWPRVRCGHGNADSHTDTQPRNPRALLCQCVSCQKVVVRVRLCPHHVRMKNCSLPAGSRTRF